MTLLYLADPVTRESIGSRDVTALDMDLVVEDQINTSALSTLVAAPEALGETVAVLVDKDTWEIQPDHRGYVGYDSDGVEHAINMINIEPDGAWTNEPPFVFDDALLIKFTEIVASYKQAMTVITGVYTSEDIASFPVQEAEANAWDDDNSAVTPLIDLIVANRPSVDKATLVGRILFNSQIYKAVAGPAIGKKQALDDLTYALKAQHEDAGQPDGTQADLDAIVVDFS